MLKKYGFTQIKIGDEIYNVSPSFGNIAKIDDIEFSMQCIYSVVPNIDTYREAVEVVNACLDKPLPKMYDQQIKMVNGKTKLVNPPPLADQLGLICLAKHCVLHGVVGKSDYVMGEQAKESNDKFNVYAFINSAQDKRALGRSREEALNMSMSEYIDAMRTAFPDAFENKVGFTQDEMDLWKKRTGQK
jgi:hypothetical protein